MEFNYYEIENKKVSVANLLEFYNVNLILNNELIDLLEFYEVGHKDDDEYDDVFGYEVYQYYIIRERDIFIANLLDEPLYYCEEADLYLLGVTHFGTGWDYVLTQINLLENDNGEYRFDFEQIRELW